MIDNNNILAMMMQNDLPLDENQGCIITHHTEKSPGRIDLKTDEVAFIHDIVVNASKDFWLEYHSATESRLIEEKLSENTTKKFITLTRHKGSIYFTASGDFEYQVSYVKLKTIK